MFGGCLTKILNNYKGYFLAGKLCLCILRYDPEVLVIATCGFTIDRTLEEIHLLTKKEGWDTLNAVQNNAVFIAYFELFTQSSAGTLVDGIEVLQVFFIQN